MIDLPPHRYLADASQASLRSGAALAAFKQLSRSREFGVLPIVSLNHLAVHARVSLDYLRQVVGRTDDPYIHFRRKKQSGGWRGIDAPEPRLLLVQKLLLNELLDKIPKHSASYAYTPGRSHVDCARQHVGAKWLAKFDIHNFFGSIGEKRVYRLFLNLGYAPLVAFEVSRLLTWPSRTPFSYPGPDPGDRYSAITKYAHEFGGVLPQGSPASGAIANVIMNAVDKKLNSFAIENGFIYTRYSDDLTFSTSSQWSRKQFPKFHSTVATVLDEFGFELHKRKTRLIPPRSRKIILGIVVEADSIHLPKEFKSRVERMVRLSAISGIICRSGKEGYGSFLNFVAHVEGSLAYAYNVEPSWANRQYRTWQGAMVDQSFPTLRGR